MSNTPGGLPLTSSRIEQIFPILTPAQINRIAVHGQMRAIEPGKVLVEQGDSTVPFFVVVSGELEIVRPSGAAEPLVTIHGPGQFTGEVNMLSGRRTLVRMRATKPSKVIELDRQPMMALIQTDAELGEILTRAFILRRVEGFDIRQKSYALKRSMKLSVCKICYDTIDIDGFDDVINMNIDGKLQEVTRIRKL